MADGSLSGAIDPEQIAKDFCVSRSVMRESLRALEAKGMIRAKQRTGTQVTPVSEWSLLDPDVIGWRTAGADRFTQLRDSIELRGALEPLGAQLTAARGGMESIAALREAAARIAEAAAAGDVASIIEADVAFHSSLLTGSGNGMLAQLALAVAACLRVADISVVSRITGDVAQRHQTLVDSIAAGDAAEAARRSLALVTYSRGLLDDAIAQAVPSKDH
ncbi:MAG: FadR/GntR family transcriptional regulator [Solirubrobacteraceae bacterium]